jgi:enoyl-CoA hydratase
VPRADGIAGTPGPMGPTRLALPKPVIAAIEGYAVAGGLELAVWADLRVMADNAVLGVYCRRWGVPLIDGGTVRLPRLIGEGRALDLILTGRDVRADEALAIGLVSRVCEPGEALTVALELAEQIAAFPQECMRLDRSSAVAAAGATQAEALAFEVGNAVPLLASGLVRDGARAFADTPRDDTPRDS